MLPSTRLRLTTSTMLFTGLGGLLLSPLAVLTPTATASSTYLCNGYSSCGQAGYSDGGYGRVNNRMFWRMYSGHNCTNYVAHRLIQAGMSTERPWSGSGMAYNWGFAMKDITDTKPTVGSVAWWNRGVSGAGSSGHVAMVERVISPTEIVISEDSWSGDFHWRRIVKGSSGWPTGFIHFVDKVVEKSIANESAPRVSGTPQVGVPLRAMRGAWSTSGTFSYQWLADGIPVAGADRIAFTPTPAQANTTIAVRVDATKPGFSGSSATSAATPAVAPGVIASGGAPVVSGVTEVDEMLTATTSGWAPSPNRTRFSWRVDGRAIAGADGATLPLGPSYVGKRITVVEVARSAGYDKAVTSPSVAVGPVVAGTIDVTQPFTASGRTRVGEDLTIVPGVVEPSDATTSVEWRRDGEVVGVADQATYRLTGEDLGARMTARVTLTKPRYRPVVRTVTFADPVTTLPVLTVKPAGRSKAAVVVVRAAAPGVRVVDGDVTVVVGNRTVTAPLVDGAARVVVSRVPAGPRRVVVTYAGTSLVERVVARSQVRILR